MRTPLRILGAAVATSLAAAVVPLLSSSEAQAVQFTGGNLVVYRVGDGAAPLSNAASAVFLDEFSPAGTKVQSLALPTSAGGGNSALTAVGQSRSEGLIANSADGKLLTLTGYAAAPGTTGPGGISLTGSAPATVGRVVGVVDGTGAVDTSTVLTGPGTPQIVRSAVTDGTRVWAAGGNGGVLTTQLGSGTVSTVAGGADANLNALTFQGDQLFASGILTNRLTKVGTGAPTGSATLTDLTGLPDNLLAYGYALLDLTPASYAGTGLDTLYVANSSERGGTVDKYRFNGSTWTSAGYLDVEGATGLVADVDGSAVSLAVTTPTELVALSDPNGAGSTFAAAEPRVLATAPANTEFRGVALAPTGLLDVPDGAFTGGTYSWTDKRVSRTGTWKTYAVSKAPGKKGLSSSKKSSTLTASVVGGKLAITFGTSPKSGKLTVTVDGKKTTVDLFAKKVGTLAKSFTLVGADAHTVKVKVLGTKSKKSKGTAVNLAFLKVTS
jgi:hypothetical protein